MSRKIRAPQVFMCLVRRVKSVTLRWGSWDTFISFALPQENEQAKAGIGADCFFVKSTKAAWQVSWDVGSQKTSPSSVDGGRRVSTSMERSCFLLLFYPPSQHLASWICSFCVAGSCLCIAFADFPLGVNFVRGVISIFDSCYLLMPANILNNAYVLFL